MPEFLSQALLFGVAINVVASGLAGLALTRRVGAAPWLGLVVGALLPWVGPLILALVLVRRPRVWATRPSRTGFRLAGILGLIAGGVFVFASSFVEWAQAQVSALQYEAGGAWGAGDSTLTAITTVIALVFIALGVGAWAKGGLRFGLPAAFLAAQVSSASLLLVALAGLAPGLNSQAQQFSGGILRLSLVVGRGAWLALLGCAVIVVGSLCLLAKPSGTSPVATSQEPALGILPASTPVEGQPQDTWGQGGQASSGWSQSGGGSTDGW